MSILLKIGGGSFVVDHLSGGLASALPAIQHQHAAPPDDWEFSIVSPRDPASGLPTGQRMHKPVAYDGLPTGQRMHKPLATAAANSGALVMQRQVFQMSGLNAGRMIPQLTLEAAGPGGQVNRSVKLLNATIVAVKRRPAWRFRSLSRRSKPRAPPESRPAMTG